MSSKIALLIDAENISYSNLPRILAEVPRHGELVLRAVYGDWESSNLQTWREIAEPHKFKFRHQANPSKIKNSSDMKLIMDAMEVLYKLPAIDIFCLVTSDADFVPLCDKLRKSKKQVIGIGYQNAAEALIRACDKFIFIRRPEGHTEPLLPLSVEVPVSVPKTHPSPPSKQNGQVKSAPAKSTPDPKQKQLESLKKLLSQAFDGASENANGWVTLNTIGQALSKIQKGFKTNTYGHSTLTKLFRTMPDFVELKGNGPNTSARLKK